MHADAVLLATGGYERSCPSPAGPCPASSPRAAPRPCSRAVSWSRRTAVVAGTGPLLLPVAAGLAAAGARVAALVESADPASDVARARARRRQVAEGRRVRGAPGPPPGPPPAPATPSSPRTATTASTGRHRRRASTPTGAAARHRDGTCPATPSPSATASSPTRSRRPARLPTRRRRRHGRRGRTRASAPASPASRRRGRPPASAAPTRARRGAPRRAFGRRRLRGTEPDPAGSGTGRQDPGPAARLPRTPCHRLPAARLDRVAPRRHPRLPLRGGHRRSVREARRAGRAATPAPSSC